jgi:CheY-like chemotaxis protein
MDTPIKLLVIEDSQEDADLLLRTLRKGGLAPDFIRVDTAEDLQRALDARPWDLVISDYSMPAFDGSRALAMVRAADPDMPFLFFSGTLGVEVAVEAMRQGASDYYLKGHWNHLTRLVAAVRRELEKVEMRHRLKAALGAMGGKAAAIVAWQAGAGLAEDLLHELQDRLGPLAGDPAERGARLDGLLSARMAAVEGFRRLGEARLIAMDLNHAVMAAAEAWQPGVRRRLQADLPAVAGDPEQIRPLIEHLGGELLDRAGSGGWLELETGRYSSDSGEAAGKTRDYGMLTMRVASGRGVAPRGLRRALAEALALRNGGLFMQEQEGDGFAFKVCLPIWQAPASGRP